MSPEIDEIRRRKQLADNYYNNHLEYLRRNDLGKASEFLWGTINNLAYCLGLLDGQKLGEHAKVIEYLELLASIRQDKELVDEIAAAQTLHANFYHDFMSKDVFDYNRTKADQFAHRLALILMEKLKELGQTI